MLITKLLWNIFTCCVIIRWSNSEVWLKQWKIPIISVDVMKIIDERESVMQGILQWGEIIAKYN